MSINVNGAPVALPQDPRMSLLDLLREQEHLSGTKKGCNQGACGACTILVNGERILSCLALAVQYDGQEITTIEGLGSADDLHPIQRAFVQHDGFQCGYCTPGFILMTRQLLDATPDPTDDDIRHYLSGNLCRCAAYPEIIEAVKLAAAKRRGSKPARRR